MLVSAIKNIPQASSLNQRRNSFLYCNIALFTRSSISIPTQGAAGRYQVQSVDFLVGLWNPERWLPPCETTTLEHQYSTNSCAPASLEFVKRVSFSETLSFRDHVDHFIQDLLLCASGLVPRCGIIGAAGRQVQRKDSFCAILRPPATGLLFRSRARKSPFGLDR
ncbi:hypothetical protein B0H12DRAFT_1128180 [Mycena haematopus]|nr:hypothetical protein B0H12DRAFT_1128180 [Mycena haematopus]